MKQILSTIILIGMAVSIFVWKEFDRINQKDYQLQQIAEHKLKEKQELDQVDALRQKNIESKSKHRVHVLHDSHPETNTYAIILDATGSRDPDPGDELTYEWIQTSGNPVELKPHVKAPIISFEGSPGEYVFELIITDNYGATTRKEKSVIINPEPNQSPVADIKVRKGKGTI